MDIYKNVSGCFFEHSVDFNVVLCCVLYTGLQCVKVTQWPAYHLGHG